MGAAPRQASKMAGEWSDKSTATPGNTKTVWRFGMTTSSLGPKISSNDLRNSGANTVTQAGNLSELITAYSITFRRSLTYSGLICLSHSDAIFSVALRTAPSSRPAALHAAMFGNSKPARPSFAGVMTVFFAPSIGNEISYLMKRGAGRKNQSSASVAAESSRKIHTLNIQRIASRLRLHLLRLAA